MDDIYNTSTSDFIEPELTIRSDMTEKERDRISAINAQKKLDLDIFEDMMGNGDKLSVESVKTKTKTQKSPPNPNGKLQNTQKNKSKSKPKQKTQTRTKPQEDFEEYGEYEEYESKFDKY